MASTHGYRLYGLRLSSALALPFPRTRNARPFSVVLSAAPAVRFASVRRELTTTHTRRDWFCCKRLTDGTTYLHWDRLFEFIVSQDGRRIWYRRLEDGTRESFYVYLLGPVLSFALLARGIEPLHGTATVIDGSAVVFLGGCGRGKSTLAAALLARGFPVLTDDLVALVRRNTQWFVHRGLPRLKLFPSIANRVLEIGSPQPRLNAGTTKLVLPLERGHARQPLVPLRSIYVLAPPGNSTTRTTVRIETLAARDVFLEIVGAAFNLAVVERERLANQFVFARRLSADVPVRRLIYPRRLSELAAVCDALLEDVRGGRSTEQPQFAGTATT